MERFGGSLPVKGYIGEMAGKKRVQLPADLGKGMFIVYILTSWIVLNVRAMLKRNFYFKSKTFFESLSVEWNYYWKLTRWCKLSRQGSLFLNLLNLKICVLRQPQQFNAQQLRYINSRLIFNYWNLQQYKFHVSSVSFNFKHCQSSSLSIAVLNLSLYFSDFAPSQTQCRHDRLSSFWGLAGNDILLDY